MTRDHLTERLANLSPVKRALLKLRLEEKGTILPVEQQIIPRRSTPGLAPLSFAQQRLWFLNQLEPESSAYNESNATRLSGPLDVLALEKALNQIVARHEVLRTTIVVIDGTPQQLIAPSRTIDLPVIDLRARTDKDRNSEAHRLTIEATRRPFDLSRDLMLRGLLLRLTDQEHILLLVKHHIASDGWSAGILWQELTTLYRAFTTGEPSLLPDLPVQYADYAVWQRGWLQGEALESQLKYWKKQLASISTLLLPTDRPLSAVHSHRGARQLVEFPKDLSQALKFLSRQENVTLFMTLLAAFQTLLHRYTGQENISVGSPIAGRTRSEIEGLIGFFVNTLVLSTDLSGNPSFRELLGRVREVTLGAYAHQDLPFEKLVEELQPERNLSRSPLFQVAFVLQNAPRPALKFEGLSASPERLNSETVKFDLTLTMHEEAEALRASLQYNTDLFDAATIERMLGHFQVLLKGIIADPNQRILDLSILTEAENYQLLADWNDTNKEYPKDKCIQELFEEQVKKSPDAVAVIFEDCRLTYQELNTKANQLAHFLRARGIGPQTPVGVFMERRPELLVGLLGIVKSGGAYVPLDPDLPRERLDFMLQDTGAVLLLTQKDLLRRLPETVSPPLCLDRDWPQISSHSPSNPEPNTSPDHLAYIMYTSGSTGKPKGVAIRQQGIIRLVKKPNYVTFSVSDTVAQVSNIAFDAATFEIWGALLNGARLAIISREITLSPARLTQALASHRISCMFLTTALFNRVSVEKPEAFRSLRYLLFGGESCDRDRVRAVLDAGPPEHLVHVYGPTETTTFATYHEVRHVGNDRTVPIGRPITATEVILLDASGKLVPPGIVGEIYIGGAGLAFGYVGRPEETEARFVPHPLRPETGERVYRTGDLARRRADGPIEFVGRTDDQVKIRGFRIEPAEVNAILNSHPVVRASHVMARQQASRDIGLTAYFVATDVAGDPTGPSELRRFLSERLPSYMVPASFVRVPSIPLTPNGKVDCLALPDPRVQDMPAHNDCVEPRDETERVLCRVWSEVLGVSRIGLDDDFFAIGGHSLLAAKLFARLDEEFGRSLPLGVLFAAPTVRALAERYRAAKEASKTTALIALTTGGSLPPVYAVPGVYGNVIGFADLARELGPEQPFYGLQSVGLDGGEAPLDSIEEMAALYVAEIRSMQPHGPYAIVGACFGATVAYEMARQLLAAGEEVGFLGLLDPTRREGNIAGKNPESTPRIFKRLAAFRTLVVDRLQLYREDMRRLGIIDRVKYLASKFHLLSGLIGNSNAFKGAQRELNQIEVYRANLLALDVYRREPLDGRLRALEIFETTRPGRVNVRDRIDWRALWNGPIKNHKVPGKNSGDMLSGENARVLGALLAQRLRLALHAPQRHCSEGRWID